MGSDLARCTEPSCPVRYKAGPDRPCALHGDDDDTRLKRAAAELGLDMAKTHRWGESDGS